MNLLEEIKDILKENNKKIEDIEWVGTTEKYVDIDIFLKLANTNYDDDYGAPEVAQDLIIVGNNWWLERHEYDGSEWFEYKSMFEKPKEKLELKALTIDQARKLNFDISCGWENLEEINGKREYKE